MARIQRATASDVPALLPLVAEYWKFEAICGFEPQRVDLLWELGLEVEVKTCWPNCFLVDAPGCKIPPPVF
jgi:hypothetical protein